MKVTDQRQRRLFKTTMVVDIPGDDHHVAGDVLFAHLSHAMTGLILSSGPNIIIVDDGGGVYVNDELIYQRKERVR